MRVSDVAQTTVSVLIRLVWVAPLAGAAYSTLNLMSNWESAKTAPEQAAVAGYALACTVLPYCFARAITGIVGKSQA